MHVAGPGISSLASCDEWMNADSQEINKTYIYDLPETSSPLQPAGNCSGGALSTLAEETHSANLWCVCAHFEIIGWKHMDGPFWQP